MTQMTQMNKDSIHCRYGNTVSLPAAHDSPLGISGSQYQVGDSLASAMRANRPAALREKGFTITGDSSSVIVSPYRFAEFGAMPRHAQVVGIVIGISTASAVAAAPARGGGRGAGGKKKTSTECIARG